MPARLLGLPVLALFIWSVYAAWGAEDQSYAFPILFSVLMLALIYVFSPEINWRYYLRYTPSPDKPVLQMLRQFGTVYNNLTEEEQKKFEQRLFLTVTATDFMLQGLPSLPEDIKYMLAYPQVCLNRNQEKWLCDKLQKTVVYGHPFPSPAYSQNLHASEWFAEDGVLIFSLPHVLEGFTKVGEIYNVVFHEQAKVFRECHPELELRLPEEDWVWEKLTTISGLSKATIEQTIGLPQSDPYPVSVHHFFCFPKAFGKIWPELYAQYAGIFGYDPLNAEKKPD